MGRTTYEWILDHEFWGKDPGTGSGRTTSHAGSSRTVSSGRPRCAVEFTSADVSAVHAAMAEAAGERDAWIVGGGDLAGQFAEAGLLDEVIVYIAPVTLGAGAPLLPRRIELRLEELARNRDFACARYSVVRPGGLAFVAPYDRERGLRRGSRRPHPRADRRRARPGRAEDVRRARVSDRRQHGDRGERPGRVLVRADPARVGQLVATTGASRWRCAAGRWRAGSGSTGPCPHREALAEWVELGVAYARSLPAKR